jgi:hypothetical protein
VGTPVVSASGKTPTGGSVVVVVVVVSVVVDGVAVTVTVVGTAVTVDVTVVVTGGLANASTFTSIASRRHFMYCSSCACDGFD